MEPALALPFRTIVINLDRDPERLVWMTEQLDALGMPFTRQRGILGTEANSHFPGLFKNSPLKLGEIGCWASHLEIARTFAANPTAAPLLVLEDDVLLPPDLPALLSELVAALPEEWDIVRLSNAPKRRVHPVAALPGGRELVRYTRISTSTGASLLSARGAAKFGLFKPHLFAIDAHLARPWTVGLVTYGITPAPVTRDCLGASTIDAIDAGRSLRKHNLLYQIRKNLFDLRYVLRAG